MNKIRKIKNMIDIPIESNKEYIFNVKEIDEEKHGALFEAIPVDEIGKTKPISFWFYRNKAESKLNIEALKKYKVFKIKKVHKNANLVQIDNDFNLFIMKPKYPPIKMTDDITGEQYIISLKNTSCMGLRKVISDILMYLRKTNLTEEDFKHIEDILNKNATVSYLKSSSNVDIVHIVDSLSSTKK